MSKKLLSCHGCHEEYNLISRPPYLLDCSHRICKICFQNNSFCTECGDEINHKPLCQQDYYITGILSLKENRPPKEQEDQNLKCSDATKVDSPSLCFECKKKVSTSCNECKTIFCKGCFAKSHPDSKIWQHHKLEIHFEDNFYLKIKREVFCKNHEDLCSFYCSDCKIRVCLSCDDQSHAGHAIKSIEQENKDQVVNLLESKRSHIDAKYLNEHNFEVFKSAVSENDRNKKETEEAIDTSVADLISLLQIVGKENKHKLLLIVEKENAKIEEQILNLRSYLNYLDEAVSKLDVLTEEIPKIYLSADVLEENKVSLEGVNSTKKFGGLEQSPYKFMFDEDMPKKIKKAAKLTVSSNSPTTSRRSQFQDESLGVKAEPLPKENANGNLSKANRLLPPSLLPIINDSAEWSDDEDENIQPMAPANSSSSNKITSSVKKYEQLDDSRSDEYGRVIQPAKPLKAPKLSRPCNRSAVPRSGLPFAATSAFNKDFKPSFHISQERFFGGNIYEVEIQSFESFDCFYVRIKNGVIMKKHEDLKDAMQEFYSYPYNRNDVVRPSVGFYAVVQHEGMWRRCITTYVTANNCTVFLNDLGKHLEVATGDLKKAKPEFSQVSQAAIKCCLGIIEPKAVDSTYPEKAVKEFKKITMKLGLPLKALMMRNSIKDAAIPVIVYAFPNNGKKINVNAMLVSKLDGAKFISQPYPMIEEDESSENKKLKSSPVVLHQDISTRIEVLVLRVVSPSEFYVSLTDCTEKFQNFQNELNLMPMPSSQPDKIWAINDLCLVMNDTNINNPQSLRGKIVSSTSLDQFLVFLIDKGVVFSTHRSRIYDIQAEYLEVCPAAIQVHMAGAKPTDGVKWATSSISKFEEYLSKFEKTSISIVGDKDREGSIPVSIWGVSSNKFCLKPQKKYHNIFENLRYRGYVDANRQMTPELLLQMERVITDDFGWKTLELPASSTAIKAETVAATQANGTDLTSKLITSWLAPQANDNDTFIGYPTNVDENGIIYIHTQAQQSMTNDIKSQLKIHYLDLPIESQSTTVVINQAVIMQNQFDGDFYRGVIESLPTSKHDYRIRLVDFGVVEYISRDDIYSNVITSNIPIQTNKYRLASAVPVESSEWADSTLEILHGLIVDFPVNVRIVAKADDIHECYISLRNNQKKDSDVAKYLIEHELAVWRKQEHAWPPMKKSIVSKFEEEENLKYDIEAKELNAAVSLYDKPNFVHVSVEETQQLMAEQEHDLNIHTDTSQMSHLKSVTPCGSPIYDVFRMKPRFKRRNIKKKKKSIEYFDLQANEISEFECTFARIVGVTQIYVTTNIPELTQKMFQMRNILNDVNEGFLMKFSNVNAALERLCLVNIDGEFHRGRVIAIEEGLPLVFFLDSAEEKTVAFGKVYRMPMQFRNFPKGALSVVLSNIKINPNYDEPEIIAALTADLKDKVCKAVVMGYNERDYPIVKLIDQQNQLAYQNLIDNKYYNV